MIGIDITHIKRFEQIENTDFTHWKHTFTEQEWQYAFSKPNPAQHLASTFSAKEAVVKAVLKNIPKNKIHIERNKNGVPNASTTSHKSPLHISITHDAGLAVAVCIVVPSYEQN